MKILWQDAKSTTQRSKWQRGCSADAQCGLIGVAVPAQSDSPARLFESFVQFVTQLSDPVFLTFLRLALLLIICTTLCGLTLQRFAPVMQRGSVRAIQAGCCLVGLFVALTLPIALIRYTPLSKAFVFLIALFTISVLPYRLAYTLTPKQCDQVALAKAIYVLVLLLFCAGLIF